MDNLTPTNRGEQFLDNILRTMNDENIEIELVAGNDDEKFLDDILKAAGGDEPLYNLTERWRHQWWLRKIKEGIIANTPVTQTKSVTITENKTTTITPDEGKLLSSVEVVTDVPTGGSSVERKDVNFIDYDGTVLYAYTAADFAALDALPANPSHDGLTAQGWNWSLAAAKTYVSTYGMLDIGQMYVSADGKTRLYITIPENAPSHARTLELKFGITSGSVTVDYGDGSDTVTVTSSSVSLSHDYTNTGDYVITLTVNSGTVQFNKKIFNDSSANANLRPWLTRVEIGSSVTSIGSQAFYNCYALQSVTIPSIVTSIGNNAFNYCYALQSVTIPSSVTSIGSQAFYSCGSLQSVTIPSSVTSIENSAFNSCYALQSVTIPSSVTSIGNNAFNYCYGLRAIHFKPTTPPTVDNSNAWSGLQTSCKIYVPTGKLSDYTGATNYPSSQTYTYVEE